MLRLLVLSVFLVGLSPAIAQTIDVNDQVDADQSAPLIDPSTGDFSIQNLMDATRNQENRANRRNISTNLDAEIERFRRSEPITPRIVAE